MSPRGGAAPRAGLPWTRARWVDPEAQLRRTVVRALAAGSEAASLLEAGVVAAGLPAPLEQALAAMRPHLPLPDLLERMEAVSRASWGGAVRSALPPVLRVALAGVDGALARHRAPATVS